MPSPSHVGGDLDKLRLSLSRKLPAGKQLRDELVLDHIVQLLESSGGLQDHSLKELPLYLQLALEHWRPVNT
eukprot:CAMPEP_0206404370 /NCGR_PEP_ID=MMETSP0294-20121207/28330_1 /ASSEMBLY_ACC=CAM_ASM_000327 /TAXON_ID=39354 /ORGANISM="Heterosigma akashiwo, Strain CCMP2393" /LENGTH=71 /DNA_ID=CAMNT_0053862259 /DNA_START=57 /DNA_END=272 /DNA_ORIENTATION=-